MPKPVVLTIPGGQVAPGDVVRYGNRQTMVTQYLDGNAVVTHWDTTTEPVAFLNDEPVTVERLTYEPGRYEPPTTLRELLTILDLHAGGAYVEAGFAKLPDWPDDRAIVLAAQHLTTCPKQPHVCPVCVLITAGCPECGGNVEEIVACDAEAHRFATRPDGTPVVLVGCQGYCLAVVSAAWTVLPH